MRRITVTAYGSCTLQDLAPADSYAPGASVSANFSAGDVKTFDVTETHFQHSLRRDLNRLSARRVPVSVNGVLTGKTGPLLQWTQERVPGGRPRLHQVEGTVSVGGAAQTLTLRGENLISGVVATASTGKGTGKLSFTAARKGWQGNLVSVVVAPALGAGSVSVLLGDDGSVTATVTPAAAASNANAIAAQLNGNTTFALFATATGSGTGAVTPQTIQLSNGDGAGVAWNWIKTAVAGSYLFLESVTPGNNGNAAAVQIAAASGAGSVALTNGVWLVTPAAASNTLTAVAAQINNDAAMKLVVKATVMGTGTTPTIVTPATYLAAGSGETPSVKIGGAVVSITAMTDTSMALAFTGGIVTAAGVANGEQALITVLTDFGLLSAQVTAGA